MTTTQTISPTDAGYFTAHSSEALHSIVKRYTDISLNLALSGSALSGDAMSIANAAWFELQIRGEA